MLECDAEHFVSSSTWYVSYSESDSWAVNAVAPLTKEYTSCEGAASHAQEELNDRKDVTMLSFVAKVEEIFSTTAAFIHVVDCEKRWRVLCLPDNSFMC